MQWISSPAPADQVRSSSGTYYLQRVSKGLARNLQPRRRVPGCRGRAPDISVDPLSSAPTGFHHLLPRTLPHSHISRRSHRLRKSAELPSAGTTNERLPATQPVSVAARGAPYFERSTSLGPRQSRGAREFLRDPCSAPLTAIRSSLHCRLVLAGRKCECRPLYLGRSCFAPFADKASTLCVASAQLGHARSAPSPRPRSCRICRYRWGAELRRRAPQAGRGSIRQPSRAPAARDTLAQRAPACRRALRRAASRPALRYWPPAPTAARTCARTARGRGRFRPRRARRRCWS